MEGRRSDPYRTRIARRARLALAAGAALALAGAPPAEADQPLGEWIVSGEAELGGRFITGNFDSAKYEEYRQQRPGVFGGGRFLAELPEVGLFLRGGAEDAGENDQGYWLEGGRYGVFRIELEYDELQHTFSNEALTLYRDEGGGKYTLPDAVQAAVQAGGSPALQAALAGARPVSLGMRLRRGAARLEYEPIPGMELFASYRIRDREGSQPYGVGFGSPGGHFVNLASRVEDRIHEATTELRFRGETWNVEMGYVGSFFRNDLDSFTVDNFLRLTDSAADGSSRGRMSLPPDNAAHTARIAGAWTLPTGFPARIVGAFSYGMRFQDQAFVPHTINSAFAGNPALALPEDSLDGEVHTRLANVRLTARPLPRVNLTARYRMYDFDNETDVIAFPGHVVNDEELVDDSPRFTTPNSYRRHNASLDARIHLFGPASLKTGYEWERWNRSNDREVDRSDEHTGRAALDVRMGSRALLRASYEGGVRRIEDYDTFAHLAHTVIEAEADAGAAQSQFRLLRKFDQSEFVRNETRLLAQLMPCETATFSLTGSYSRYDYEDSNYGLTDREIWSAGADGSWAPLSWLSLSAYYTYENIWSRQDSRWRPRNFFPGLVIDDPRNDWTSQSEDRVHNAGAAVDLSLVPDRLDLRLDYTLQIARAETEADGPGPFVPAPPPTTSGDGGNAVDWPDIEDMLHVLRARLSLHPTDFLTLRWEYRYERFDLENFKTDGLMPFMGMSNINGSGVVSPSTDVFLGDRIEDYDAHIFALSAIVRF